MTIYTRTSENQEDELLEALEQSPAAPQQVAQRASLILLSAQGHKPAEIASEVKLSLQQVRKWLQRFSPPEVDGTLLIYLLPLLCLHPTSP